MFNFFNIFKSNKTSKQTKKNRKSKSLDDKPDLDFLNNFQMDDADRYNTINYDIIKNSKRDYSPLDKNSIKYLKYMETFEYNNSNDNKTAYIIIIMHSSLKVYYDDFLNKAYYETLPSPVDLYRLKPAPQHSSCVINFNNVSLNELIRVTPKHDNIENYFKRITETGVISSNTNLPKTGIDKYSKKYELEDKWVPNERKQTVYTEKQTGFYINKTYSIDNKFGLGIYFSNDITFTYPVDISNIHRFVEAYKLTTQQQILTVGTLNGNDITYKKEDNLLECVYFVSYVKYIKNTIKLTEKIHLNNGAYFGIKEINSFMIFTYFKNCSKLVCPDVSCETIEEIPKNKQMLQKYKELRRLSMSTGLRGGSSKKRFK